MTDLLKTCLEDSFVLAYCDCALWASTDDDDTPLDKHHGLDSFHHDTLAAMYADCRRFMEQAGDIDDERPDAWGQAGHDFWLTRNGHGAGFWDGDWPVSGDRLTELSSTFGEFDLCIGEDGLIHGHKG